MRFVSGEKAAVVFRMGRPSVPFVTGKPVTKLVRESKARREMMDFDMLGGRYWPKGACYSDVRWRGWKEVLFYSFGERGIGAELC